MSIFEVQSVTRSKNGAMPWTLAGPAYNPGTSGKGIERAMTQADYDAVRNKWNEEQQATGRTDLMSFEDGMNIIQQIMQAYKANGSYGAASRKNLRQSLQNAGVWGLYRDMLTRGNTQTKNWSDRQATRALSAWADPNWTHFDNAYGTQSYAGLQAMLGNRGNSNYVGADAGTAATNFNNKAEAWGRQQFIDSLKNKDYSPSYQGITDLMSLQKYLQENGYAVSKKGSADNIAGAMTIKAINDKAASIENPYERAAFLQAASTAVKSGKNARFGKKSEGGNYSVQDIATISNDDYLKYLDSQEDQYNDFVKSNLGGDLAGRYQASMNGTPLPKAEEPTSKYGNLNYTLNTAGAKFKLGGIMRRKFQDGGNAPAPTPASEQGQGDMMEQIAQLVQAAMNGDQEAAKTIDQIMAAAKQGDQQAQQIAQLIQQVAAEMQGAQGNPQAGPQDGAVMAQKGAKLAYIHSLKTGCPPGYEVTYYKKGGHICKECVKKQQAKKAQNGMEVPEEKCGGKARKHQNGGTADQDQQRSDSIANKLKKQYPQYTTDQLAGRAPIKKNGKTYWMNGDGKLMEDKTFVKGSQKNSATKHANGGNLNALRAMFAAYKG